MINMLIALAAFCALGLAVIAVVRERWLRQSLHDAHRRLYLAQARLNELEHTLQRELQSLRAAVRRQSGAPVVEPTMKIADAIAIDARVRDVLAQFHLGGCSACAIDEEQTIAQAAMSYGVDVDRLMVAITSLANGQMVPDTPGRHGGLLQLSDF